MKRILLLSFLIAASFGLRAQIDTVTISQIQMVMASDLAACIDTSSYLGDTVFTRGVVMMDGGNAFRNSGHNVWIQDGTGAWNGVNIDDSDLDNNLDILLAGDSISILGVVGQFNGETQIDPVSNGVTVLGGGIKVEPTRISVSDLNDANQTNLITTGEQWEGQYVELVGPLTVTSVTTFSSGTRANITLSDANGFKVGIADRFPAGRSTSSAGGLLVVPQVNARYDTVRGVIWHNWPNGCLGNTNVVNNGYEINIFLSSDIVVQSGSAAPQISNLTFNPVVPVSTQDVNVNATVIDVDGTVTGATLFYAVGASNTNYLSVPMTNTAGDNYTAAIPATAFSDGDFVKFYVCATDNDNLTTCLPDVPSGTTNPRFFVIRDNGLTIRDVQFTPFSDNRSGYVDQEVTLTGIVTASAEANSLGTVFMQQPGINQWAGIQLLGNAALANLKEGDEVEVTGTVRESFGFTLLNDITTVNTLSTGNTSITATEVAPDNFTAYDFQLNEPYESMLIKVKPSSTTNRGLFVVDENADDPNDFGEYRVGTDIFDPAVGCRVLAGRNTGSAPGSLNFSYVNDSAWATNSGIMNVSVYKVSYQDSMASVTGIMYYSFGNMKLLPRRNSDMESYSGFYGFSVDVEGPLAGSAFAVYPNPAQDFVQLDYTFPMPVTANVVMRDMLGRQLTQRTIQGVAGKVKMSTSNMNAGVYLLQVVAEGQVVSTQKVVVQ